MESRSDSVLVIGAGPAGLAAAIRLRTAGFRPKLIDAGAPPTGEWSGGSISHDLPPVLLGSDRDTITLLEQLGTAKHVRFSSRLHYEFYASPKSVSRLRRPLGPAFVRTVLSLAAFPGLSLRDRRGLLSFLERTWESDPPLDLDLDSRTADRWLDQIGQSEQARRFVWDPLARFLLGDGLGFVSARLFADALRRCFLSDARSARLALPSNGLASLLLEPAFAYLRGHGAAVRRSTTVTHIRFDGRNMTEVELEDGQRLRANWFVFAVPHDRLTALLPERMLTRYAYFQQIGRLEDVAAVTVHLWLAEPLTAPRLILLAEHAFHWLTSRQVTYQGESMSLVSLTASGNKIPKDRSDATLLHTALEVVTQAFTLKTAPRVVLSSVERKLRACLSVRPGTVTLRPLQQSPVSNLLVAGAWTETGLPGTIESAIRSGKLCADAIAAHTAGNARQRR